MSRFQHLALAGLLLGLPSAAAAQNNTAPANVVTPAPAPREGTVGPEQLRDFALPGTRQAAPAPTETPQAAPPAATRTPVVRTAPAPAAARPTPEQVIEPPRGRPEPSTAATATQPAQTREPETVTALPPSTLAPPPQSSSLEPSSLEPSPLPPSTAVTQSSAEAPSLLQGWWPWLLVAALAGIGLAMVLRQRQRHRPVLAGPVDEVFERSSGEPESIVRTPVPPVPTPAPAAPPLPTGVVTTRLRQPPAPPSPAPEVAPSPAVPTGVVSVRLRGWIDLDVAVREILFDANEARLLLDLLVANSGTGGVRDVALEALMLNGGDDQAAELANFYARPAGAQAAISELGPRSDLVLSHELVMPRGAIRAYEAQGRTLFVPIVALNAAYRSASGEGRTSAAFLVGRDIPGSDKLAPLLLPEGPGRQLGLGVRRLEEAVRR